MEKEIRNVVFDLGGVLVDLDIERCRAAFRSLGMDAVAALLQPYYPVEVLGQLERGDLTFHEACDEMRRISATPRVTDDRIAWAYGEFLTGVPLAKIRMIDRLRERGIRTYVLSNNNPRSMLRIRDMFRADGREMDDYFDRIYLSYEMHLLKPEEEIFRRMVDDSGMDPARTLFIDDGQRNVDTAQRLGFAVYKPAPEEDFSPLLDRLP